MTEPQFTLIGRARNIDLTFDPARLEISIRNRHADVMPFSDTWVTITYRLQSSQPDVLEQLRHVTDGQLISVNGLMPTAMAPGAALDVIKLEILGIDGGLSIDPWAALADARRQLLVTADHIRAREGWSAAYLEAARAADRAREVLASRPAQQEVAQ